MGWETRCGVDLAPAAKFSIPSTCPPCRRCVPHLAFHQPCGTLSRHAKHRGASCQGKDSCPVPTSSWRLGPSGKTVGLRTWWLVEDERSLKNKMQLLLHSFPSSTSSVLFDAAKRHWYSMRRFIQSARLDGLVTHSTWHQIKNFPCRLTALRVVLLKATSENFMELFISEILVMMCGLSDLWRWDINCLRGSNKAVKTDLLLT